MTIQSRHRFLSACVTILISLPASAQSLAGSVRDTSGALLPGVTVEASSPALIEKVRTAVADASGQYQITNLPPGTYTITFTLPGFATVVRDEVILTGAGVTSINAEMRVGTLEESVTVTGETPVVDVQSARQTTVINGDVVRALPASRATATTSPRSRPSRPPGSAPASGPATTSSPRAADAATRGRSRSTA